MIISEEHKGEVERLLKIAHTYKDDAKQANTSAGETLNQIANMLDKEQSKTSQKHFKKVARKIYREWKEAIEGDTSTDDATTIVATIMPEEGEF